MSSPGSTEARPSMGVAFLTSFAACAVMPWIGMLSGSVVLLLGSLAVWAIGIGVGLWNAVGVGLWSAIVGETQHDTSRRSFGIGVLLGSLVGAIVGFSLCAGAIGPLDLR